MPKYGANFQACFPFEIVGNGEAEVNDLKTLRHILNATCQNNVTPQSLVRTKWFKYSLSGTFLLNTAGQGQFLFYIRLARAEFSFIYGWPGANFLLYTAGQRHGQGPIFFIYGWPRPGPAFFLYTAGQGQSFFKYMASQRQGQGRLFFTCGWPGPKILLYTVAVLQISHGPGQLWHGSLYIHNVFSIYDFF